MPLLKLSIGRRRPLAASGCLEAVFRDLSGVEQVVSGYARQPVESVPPSSCARAPPGTRRSYLARLKKS